MSWTTPKTNWNQGDHFNLEDAVRIADNIAYLKDMAAEIYPQTELYGLVYRGYYNNLDYYCLWDLVVSNIRVYSGSSFDYGYIDFVYRDKANLLALLKLYYLAEKEVTTVTDVPCSYYTSEGWTPRYYSGYAARYIPSYHQTYTSLWSHVFSNYVRPPMEFELYSDNNYRCYVRETSAYLLDNEPFWNYSELNRIENRISYVYERFSAKLGG